MATKVKKTTKRKQTPPRGATADTVGKAIFYHDSYQNRDNKGNVRKVDGQDSPFYRSTKGNGTPDVYNSFYKDKNNYVHFGPNTVGSWANNIARGRKTVGDFIGVKKKTGGSVPQRRNRNAGKFTGKSESSKYFATHPGARRKKNEYNTEYHSTDERKAYRVELNRETRKRRTPGKDVSHTKDGRLVRESRTKNRARNGKNGRSSKK